MTDKIRYEGNRLYIEDIPAAELAEKHGTPLYVYSGNQIAKNLKRLQKAFGILPGARILYALKANSNPEILKQISALGAGADTVSAGEIFLALECGFSPEMISLAGVGKTDQDIDFALKRDIGVIIVESNEELKVVSERAVALGRTARVSLRINPDVDAHTHPHISTGLKENKFGINIDLAGETARRATKLKNIDLVGIHSHIGSQITEHSPFEEAADSIKSFVDSLIKDGIRIRQIDLGGGIGVRYHNAIRHKLLPLEKEEEPLIDLDALAGVIRKKLSFPGCDIAIEPGRFIVAESGVLLTRVLYRKVSADRTFIVVDAGMNDMMRHALYSAYHQIVPASAESSDFAPVDVVGPVCETTDAFAVQRDLPALKRGDLIGIMTVGAYGFSIASNYNSRPKPAEILVDKDYARVVRNRQTHEDLI